MFKFLFNVYDLLFAVLSMVLNFSSGLWDSWVKERSYAVSKRGTIELPERQSPWCVPSTAAGRGEGDQGEVANKG